MAGLLSLTVFLGTYLLIKGVSESIAGVSVRGIQGGVWILLDGVVSIVLSLIIWSHLLKSATWVLSTLLGVAILFSGVSRLALALAARRIHAASPL